MRALTAGLVAVLLCAIAVLATASRHDLLSLLLMFVVWCAVATILEALRSLAGGRHLAWRVLGSLPLAVVVVWHVRETFRFPERLGLVVLLAVAGAAAFTFWPNPPTPLRRSGLAIAVGAVALLGTLALAFHATERSRWHLLRHHTLLGTPSWWAFSASVDDHRDNLINSLRRIPPPRSVATTARPTVQPRSSPANLVVLLVDTLRADALAALGAPQPQMPFLDRFVAGGALFSDVRSNSSWTRPAVASLHTGLAPEQHGARNLGDGLAEAHTTMAEVAAGLGLETAAFVTNYGAAGREAGFAQGFSTFEELQGEPYVRAGAVADRVRSWLDHRPDHNRGLLLYLHLLDPHEPYLAGVVPTRQTPAAYRAAYDAELAQLDVVLASLLPAIEARLAGPTAFLLVSDHGEEFFEHGLFGHGHTLYNEVLAVPAALVGDGIPPVVLDDRLELRDFFSLALEWVVDANFDVQAWAVAHHRASRVASVDYTGTGRLLLRPYLRRTFARALESPAGAFIWNAYGNTHEHYDLTRDPGQTHNLAVTSEPVLDALASAPALTGPWREGVEANTSEETQMQLRALGYAD